MGGLLLAGLLLGVIIILTKNKGSPEPSPGPLQLPEPLRKPPFSATVPKAPSGAPPLVTTAIEAIENAKGSGKAVTPEILVPAIVVAKANGLTDTAEKLATALDQNMTVKIPALVAAPDLPGVPDIDGKTGKPLWFIDVRNKLSMAIPNFPSSLATFKALQKAIGVKDDGRIGPGTLKTFTTKVHALGFERIPFTVADLAANAVKWTEVLKKNFTPGQVGRPFDVPSRQWREFVARVNSGWDELTPTIKEKFGQYIGKEVNGQEITLSGLCGVVSRAGMRGAESWLKNEADRGKYPATTKAFLSTNGLF